MMYDHFLFLDNSEKINKKILSKALNTFGNIMENGAFAPLSKCPIFHNVFRYVVLWRKGLNLYHFLGDMI